MVGVGMAKTNNVSAPDACNFTSWDVTFGEVASKLSLSMIIEELEPSPSVSPFK